MKQKAVRLDNDKLVREYLTTEQIDVQVVRKKHNATNFLLVILKFGTIQHEFQGTKVIKRTEAYLNCV